MSSSYKSEPAKAGYWKQVTVDPLSNSNSRLWRLTSGLTPRIPGLFTDIFEHQFFHSVGL